MVRKKKTLINPFKPTAGMVPPVLIGREAIVDDFLDGLDEGAGSPGRLMRITGPRGAGKTVLLTELGNIAAERGWTVVNVSGKEPLCASIQEQLARDSRLESLDLRLSLPFVSAEAKLARDEAELSFRESFARATRALSADGNGLLVTVDEAQDASREDMTVIATNVQYMIREKQNIGLLFAGITTGVLDLLNGKGLTFLRRATIEELTNIPVDEVASAFAKSIRESGLDIDESALEYAAEATAGYAYLIQLVGYYIWREGRRHAAESLIIDGADVERGIKRAVEEYGRSVIETALSGLSKTAVEYLLAMTEDSSASSTAEISRRMGKSAATASTYRRMLIARQIIEASAPGYVVFSMPFMREYLVEHRDEILARYGE